MLSTKTRLFAQSRPTYIVQVDEIGAGHLLIKKRSVSISYSESRAARAKGNVYKQPINKYHITLICAVVTFGQICNVRSDL